MAEVLKAAGHTVRCTDLIYRGYGEETPLDFLATDCSNLDTDIITNPPYKFAKQFCERALEAVADGHKVAMFLKVQFLEGKARKELFQKYPPKTIYVSSSRLLCAKNGEFQKMRDGGGSAVAYRWYVWQKGYTGDTVVKWIN